MPEKAKTAPDNLHRQGLFHIRKRPWFFYQAKHRDAAYERKPELTAQMKAFGTKICYKC